MNFRRFNISDKPFKNLIRTMSRDERETAEHRAVRGNAKTTIG